MNRPYQWPVALTLLIAESRPEQEETIVKVIVSLINRANE
jgi:hypothetical protein